MKIMITGGHMAPALAVIDQLKNHEVIFVGREYSEGRISLEYQEISKRNIRFYNLHAGRLTRLPSLKTALNILLVPFGFLQAIIITLKEKPDIVLTFGGYLGLPVAWSAHLLKIPVYLHEQTISPGTAARKIGEWATKIFISFEETEQFFPKEKVVLTGNPVRFEVMKTIKKPFDIKKNRKVIYITGGSLGSHNINQYIRNILFKLLGDYVIIHQTGDTKKYHDFEDLEKYRETLPQVLKEYYFLRKHFYAEEIGYIYEIADFVLGRAGANTFFELIAVEKPAILIPLPWAANNEQRLQAGLLEKAGAVEIFDQSNSSENLYRLIEKMNNNLDGYKINFKALKKFYKSNAAEKIIDEILK